MDRAEKVADDFSDIVKVKELSWMLGGGRSATLMAYHHYRTVSDPKTRFA